MHSIKPVPLHAPKKISGTGIGGQHAFFNKPVGIVTHTRKNFFNATIGANLHIGFNGLKLDSSPFSPCSRKRLVDTHKVHQYAV